MSTSKVNLSPREQERYARHISLQDVGIEGQEKLKNAKVLIVGAGGLGCPAALYLAAAGVGTIGLIDDDVVELSNLQRQVLYTEFDLGQPKVEIAQRQLQSLNKDIDVHAQQTKFTAQNAEALLKPYDIILSCTDNFEARYILNDMCIVMDKPFVHASIAEFEGHLAVFKGQPCYRCLHPKPPQTPVANCAEAGVIGTLPGLMGTLQASEAIKLILNIGESLENRLVKFNSLNGTMQHIKLSPDPHCESCGKNANLTIEMIRGNAMTNMPEMDVNDLKRKREAGEGFLFLDVREPNEIEFCNIGGTFIPLGQLPHRLDEIKDWQDKDVVVFCRSGGRSASAQQILLQNGFKNVTNVKGGILAWSKEIDSSIPTY